MKAGLEFRGADGRVPGRGQAGCSAGTGSGPRQQLPRRAGCRCVTHLGGGGPESQLPCDSPQEAGKGSCSLGSSHTEGPGGPASGSGRLEPGQWGQALGGLPCDLCHSTSTLPSLPGPLSPAESSQHVQRTGWPAANLQSASVPACGSLNTGQAAQPPCICPQCPLVWNSRARLSFICPSSPSSVVASTKPSPGPQQG